jgi:hypothetical protein
MAVIVELVQTKVCEKGNEWEKKLSLLWVLGSGEKWERLKEKVREKRREIEMEQEWGKVTDSPLAK